MSEYNVVDFGADPTGAKDSSAAINNAIAAAMQAGDGVVMFPDGGVYKIDPEWPGWEEEP
jgi:polygalacturonase